MMRAKVILLAALVLSLLLPGFSAGAEGYTFESIHAGVTLPEGVYETVLTPGNLKDNEAFIVSRGFTVEGLAADFEARGVLLQAYDQEEDRVLVVTALQDVDAQRIFDVNAHGTDVRAAYRISHGPRGSWVVLGYRYDAVSWKNFAKIGRFLQLRYEYREGGDLVRRGYQRRTVRNGYSITVDMQVFGRQLKGGDNTALNKVFNTFTFSKILPLPPLPITLDETATAPVETSKPSFTMKGKTKAGASMTAVVMSFSTGASKVFETVANKAGNYTLPIDLPGEDVYLMTLTVHSEGLEDLSKAYNIRYQAGLLPVQITGAPPAELLSDELVLSGVTTESGVSARLTVNGVETVKNVPRSGAFSFPIDTSREGVYDIRLTLSKKGLQDRTFQYQTNRFLNEQSRQDAVRQSAASPGYAELLSNPDAYDGQTLTYEGYITKVENADGEWLLRFALRKTDQGFEDLMVLNAETEPAFAIDTPVRVYGRMVGLSVGTDAAGQEERLPKLQLLPAAGE